jgi:hypothetical protein
MITFVDLIFSPKGKNAAEVVARLQRIPGVSSVMGEHDVVFHWTEPTEFASTIRAIHAALDGTEATYRVYTVEDSYQSRDPVPWIASIDPAPPHHPGVSERS